jgi:hypothetical protein
MGSFFLRRQGRSTSVIKESCPLAFLSPAIALGGI